MTPEREARHRVVIARGWLDEKHYECECAEYEYLAAAVEAFAEVDALRAEIAVGGKRISSLRNALGYVIDTAGDLAEAEAVADRSLVEDARAELAAVVRAVAR